ncbi:hypothetical protein [Nocardia sp. NBC_00511]|uniref:hypothetical protein n=1 Tax=Nocardia sp. NBC_00511 TaxID=2903591 RepID=UPI002F912F00
MRGLVAECETLVDLWQYVALELFAGGVGTPWLPLRRELDLQLAYSLHRVGTDFTERRRPRA